MIQYGGMGCGTKGLVKGLRKFGWDSPTPDKWSTTNTIQRHKEVWAGPRAAAGVLIKSNSYIKWSTVGRQNTAETWRSNWSTLIWYKSWNHRLYRNVSDFVSQSCHFCSSLPKPREQFWSRNFSDHPTLPAAVFLGLSIQIIHWYEPRAEHTPNRRPLSAGGHTRRGPLAGAGGLIKSSTYIKWSTVGRQNTAGKRGLTTHCFFLDVQKAYDTVWRNGLWKNLSEIGIRGMMWTMMKNMTECARSTVMLNREISYHCCVDI